MIITNIRYKSCALAWLFFVRDNWYHILLAFTCARTNVAGTHQCEKRTNVAGTRQHRECTNVAGTHQHRERTNVAGTISCALLSWYILSFLRDVMHHFRGTSLYPLHYSVYFSVHHFRGTSPPLLHIRIHHIMYHLRGASHRILRTV